MTIVTDQLQNFRPIRVGGGGWVTGHAQHEDGTLLARTDVYGCYLWHEDKKEWEQLVTTRSMPEADQRPGAGQGVYEVAIAPSDSKTFYMVYDGKIFRSINRGKSWTQAKFQRDEKMHSNVPSTARVCSRKLAVNPKDRDHVLVGTMDRGLFQTRDGGKSWSQVKDVPVSRKIKEENDPGVTGIIFDPTRDGVIWAVSHGNGYYLSVDNGKSWSRPEGGPTNAAIDCDMSGNGMLFMTEYEGQHIWRFNGSWFEIPSNGFTDQYAYAVACDPFDANRVVFASGGGLLVQSLDGGETVSDIQWNGVSVKAGKGEPSWFNKAIDTYHSCGNVSFHPKVQNRLMFSEGIGFWYADCPPEDAFATVTWNAMTRGIEELVANQVMHTPNGHLLMASWDRALFRSEDPEKFPDEYIGHGGQAINHGTGMDYCAENPDIIGLVNFTASSGISRDGGRTLTPFASMPFEGFSDGGGGGEIAIGGPDNYVWVGTNKMGARWTKDGGASWKKVKLPGVPDKEEGYEGLNFAFYLRRRICAADRVVPGRFYIFNAGFGVYRSDDGGAEWYKVGDEPVPYGAFNAKMKTVPGREGHLFITRGHAEHSKDGDFRISINGGVNWASIGDVSEVHDFGFGAPAPGADYPTIWIIGYVGKTWGIYRSEDQGKGWIRVSDGFPMGLIENLMTIDGDKKIHNRCYIGMGGSGYAYAPGTKTSSGTVISAPAAAAALAKASPAKRITVIDKLLAGLEKGVKRAKAETSALKDQLKKT